MISNIRGIGQIVYEVVYTLNKRQRKQALLLLVLMFFASFFELLGVSAIVPFVQAVLNPQELLEKGYVQAIWNGFGLSDYNSLILILGIALIIIYITKNAFIILVNSIKISYAMSWQKDISVKMLTSYIKRPYTYFMNANSSDILRGCSDDIAHFYHVLSDLFALIMELATTIVICIYLVITDAFTAICVILLLLLTILGLTMFLKPTVKRLGKVAKAAISMRNKSITQTIQGIKDIIVMQRKEMFVDAYTEAAELARATDRKYAIIRALPDRVIEGLCVSGIIGVVCIRVMIGDDSMTEFVPKLSAFAMASFKVLPSVGKITNALNTLLFSKAMQHNVYLNIKEAEQYDRLYLDDNTVDHAQLLAEYNIYENNPFQVELKNIIWRYEGQNKDVLNNLSICINKGESVGFIGPSGAGKTTTADILLGLLKPQKGTVTINENDIFEMPYLWAHIVGYVPQNVFLMDDTVRANVAFGIKDVKDDDIWEALERAQLKPFIEALPQGLDTVVGERGIKFSGGQRQRIAIARALYNRPLILVMDEATASLDNETENAVMESIEALHGQITMVIVAHRLSTIKNCDRVYEIKDGIATDVTGHDFG